MLDKRGESGHPCLVPALREKPFSDSALSMMLAVAFSYMAFIMLRYFSYTSILSRIFIIGGCWILSNAFPSFIELIVIFIFHFVYVVYHIYLFANVELSLHPWNKCHLFMVYNPYYALLNLIC